MFPGNQDGVGGDKAIDLEGESRSFHGRLLDRGQTCLPARKRDRLAKIARRATWIGMATWLARFVGEGAILAGGLALGAGISRLRRFEFPNVDESWKLRTTVFIAVGVGCILLSIMARLLARSGSRQSTQPARG